MNKEKRMNVLVVGPSGSGKSTLIKAVSGKEVLIGTGEGQTKNISVYESDIWPLDFIDTMGFEYDIFAQIKTINQIRKHSKNQIKNENNSGIDAVWYCIDGTTKRVFHQNVKLMSMAIKGWKNIPIFAVITKSLVESDIKDNIKAVETAFAKEKNTNLKNIIPVVAEEYEVNGNIVEPFGIEQLCNETLDCFDEAKSISVENRANMILNQKRFSSQKAIGKSCAIAVTIGLVPLPSALTDSTLLVPLEVAMTKRIFKIYEVDYPEIVIDKIIGGTVITIIARQIIQAIPIAGPIINAVVAGCIVTALGEGLVAASEAIYLGKIPKDDIDKVTGIINDKLSNSPVVGAVSDYFEKNKDNLSNKKPKEILDEIMKQMKKKSK